MKRIILFSVLIFSSFVFFGQTSLPQTSSPQNSDLVMPQNSDFVIGLPKVSITQLEFIKGELESKEQIISAEFVFKDNILIIETNPNVTPVLSFTDVESILTKYFNKSDIYAKNVLSLKKLRAEYYKADKYIIK